MVASIATLGSQCKSNKSFDGGYFMSLSNIDYFTAGGEPPGKWYGGGARALGLDGIVDADSLRNVLSGLDPLGKSLGTTQDKPTKIKSLASRIRKKRGDRPKHVPGYDITFSAPKSVSTLWAVAPDAIRHEIQKAMDRAVTTTLDWLESSVPLARRGKAGRTKIQAQLLVAQFDHGTSRKTKGHGFEPQLHRHCLIANLCQGSDGRWAGVDGRALHTWTRTLGPMFRATLANELKQRLGVELERPQDKQGRESGWFQIRGVPSDLIKNWSSRRSAIEELLDRSARGLAHSASAQARQSANLVTRSTKGKIPPRQELFSTWRSEASRYRFQAADVLSQQPVTAAIDPEKVFLDAWRKASATIETRQSSFTYRDAVQHLCEAAQEGKVSGVWLAECLARFLEQSREIRNLGSSRGEVHYTTQNTWRQEQRFLAEIDKLQAQPGAKVSQKIIDDVLRSRPELLDEQHEAVKELLLERKAIRILSGVAGAGKTTALDAVREGFESAGYQVIGGALSGVAAEELARKTGVPSRTVASHQHRFGKSAAERIRDRVKHDFRQLWRALHGKRTFRYRPSNVDQKTVLILDEAGMLDTKSCLAVCRHVRKHNGTILFVGDSAQLQPIEAGGPFRHLLSNVGRSHLTHNLRQQDDADRRAAIDIRRGDATSAIKNYVERDRLVVTADRGEAIQSLVRSWKTAGGARQPEKHVIFTPTRAEALIANRLCQEQREGVGELDRSRSLRNGDDVICVGDRVLFHRNRFEDGIRNGHRGLVKQVDRFRGRLTIQIDGREDDVQIRLHDYGTEGLTHAYAQTTHKAQGITVDHAYLLLGGRLADREMAYVQATRGKYSTCLFVDEAHAGQELKDLARSLGRSRQKELAHDVVERARPSLER